ncbi:MAG: bifunctional metallophosphatase/5'-nucleotidase [Paludibacteraceae bacterium]|nr:bifunctional metallophosphatase/5'-nucleotidase [Paludibacteraceae bacterium]
MSRKLSLSVFSLFCAVLTALFGMFVGCAKPVQKDIQIFFDNDVHCACKLYPAIATLRDSALKETPHVTVVSAGDFVQGGAVGTLSRGEYVTEIMNQVPYNIVTLGNHEFDYGMTQLKHLVSGLSAQVLACNFSATNGRLFFPAYTVLTYGELKVAFIGALTPTTFTSSTPTNFTDSTGRVIYDFHATDSRELIQNAADEARQKGADYVVVVGHLGDDSAIASSVDILKETRGIDVFFDGHAHHVLNMRLPNADGDSVLLVSTGSQGEKIGQLTLGKNGKMVFRFHETDSIPASPRVMATIETIQKRMEEETSRPVGYNEQTLPDYDENGVRLVRNTETALAQFATDAMREILATDVAVLHGGTLRSKLPQGDLTMGNLIEVFPFNNRAARVEMTGQQLLDAMEVGVVDYPKESGDFMIGSGLRYTINPDIPSSVELDEQELFVRVGERRRIVSMETYDSSSKTWKTIDPEKTYTVGGLDYTLVKYGVSGAFRYAKPIACPDLKDTEILARYISRLGDTIPSAMYPQKVVNNRFRVLK